MRKLAYWRERLARSVDRPRDDQGEAGFTLVEMLVVIAIAVAPILLLPAVQ